MEEVPSVKEMLERYLHSLCEHLEATNQLERGRVKELAEANNALSAQLQNAYTQTSQSLGPITSTLVTQETCHASLQACEQSLSTKLQQIRDCTTTIEEKMKEETKRFHESFKGILYFNDVAVKPYDEVKMATEELQKKIQQMIEETEREKQKATESLSNIQSKYSIISQTIANLEDVKKELSLNVSNLKKTLNGKLAALDLDPSIDLKTMRSKEEELKKEICELREKLNELLI